MSGVVLLDTHVLMWLLAEPARLGRRALKEIQKAQSNGNLQVSAISFWEIAMQARRGAVKLRSPVEQWRADVLKLGVQESPVDGRIAIRSTELMDFHADPADRMIAATALELGATLVTADEVLLEWRSPMRRQDARR